MSKTPSSQLKSLNYSGSHSTMLWYGAYQSMVLTVPKCGTIFGTIGHATHQRLPCIWFYCLFLQQCRISYTVQCRKSSRNALTVSVKCRKCGILAIVDRQAWIISEIKNMYFYFAFRLVCTIFDPWSR